MLTLKCFKLNTCVIEQACDTDVIIYIKEQIGFAEFSDF